MKKSTFSKTFSSSKIAKAIFEALAPETDNTHEKRAKTSIRVKNNRVSFVVNASDASSAKASKNTYGMLADYLKSL